MAFRMATPKRSSSGLWQSRKVIPEDVRAAYGKREEKTSWDGSLSLQEAKAKHAGWLHQIESKIASLRLTADQPRVQLTTRDIANLLSHWHDDLKRRFGDNPGDALGWEADLLATEPLNPAASVDGRQRYAWTLTPFLQDELRSLLEARQINPAPSSYEELKWQLADVYRAFCQDMIHRTTDLDFAPSSLDRLFATMQAPNPPAESSQPSPSPAPKAPPTSISGLFEGYLLERRPAPATEKSFRSKIDRLISFLGHDDARRVHKDDIVRWKDALLQGDDKEPARSAATVQEGYLAAARLTFSWGLDNGKLTENPVAGVRVRVPKTIVTREKGFTPAEAELILQAALAISTPSPKTLSAARRWIPWLCAFTGARVNEISQLRTQDVLKHEGVWCILITPEAGSVKTNEHRYVPLHSELLGQGFVEFAHSTSGPLFYEPSLARGGSKANPQHKKVGERLASWVRQIGVDDPNVAPNHGWRHRFKTLARAVDMNPEASDRITGHSSGTEASKYGHWPMAALSREIEKLPAI